MGGPLNVRYQVVIRFLSLALARFEYQFLDIRLCKFASMSYELNYGSELIVAFPTRCVPVLGTYHSFAILLSGPKSRNRRCSDCKCLVLAGVSQ